MDSNRSFGGHHVYFVFDSTILFKYNLFTKRSKIAYVSPYLIRQYYVSEQNLILWLTNYDNFTCCISCNGFIKWNDIPIKNCTTKFKFLATKNNDCITCPFQKTFYGRESVTKCKKQIPLFDSSNDGKKIIFKNKGKLYVQDVDDVDDLFDMGWNVVYVRRRAKYRSLDWIQDSNLVLINNKIIFNLDNFKEMTIRKKPKFVFYIEGMVVAIYGTQIIVYDDDKVVQIDNKTTIWKYHYGFNILITDTMDYYRIQKQNNKYILEKVILGVDYHLDRNGLPLDIISIMDSLNDTILSSIPLEILYMQLYRIYCLISAE